MAHLDLEEQEQLDQLKHFWKQYGNAISWVVTAALVLVAGWNAYQYWQNKQAVQASALFDQLDQASQAKDVAKTSRMALDLNGQFGSTAYAAQAQLLAAEVLVNKGDLSAAATALQSLVEHSADKGLQSVARLRLASLQAESKAFDVALNTLQASFPKEFEALAADRRGDLWMLQNKPDQAQAEYQKAYDGLTERSELRRLVEVKLNALGVKPAPAGAAS
jgi:predicted negative regulator of RcsB-dependent stress response